jgi:NAD(P)-dependent dehydrogenase (short-subunit alcohol dehydrogenase family)
MDLGLKGKIALLTGGGSGIGRAAVHLLLEAGAKVCVCDLDGKSAEETLSLAGANESRAIALQMDVRREADCERVVRATLERWGRLDVLCSNAGVLDRSERAGDLSLDLWERVMGVNATGAFLMSRAVLPLMSERKSGAIVNTASAAGIRGGAAAAAYTASKHAVVGLTRNIATMYRSDGIRCNAVCPGATNTNIANSIPGAIDPVGWASLTPITDAMGPLCDPLEIARPIVFLASEAARHISGAILPVDGGWSAG